MTELRKYTDLRAWLKQLGRASLHAGTGAVLGALGLNGAEQLAPEMLKGVSVDWRQMAGFFASAVFLTALRRIHEATAETTPPFPS
jgi:hypothetical protein